MKRMKTTQPKILHLTLHRKWFDLIKRGIKRAEHRDCKPYWMKRLFNDYDLSRPKKFDEVHFRNGYGKHQPLLRVKCNGVFHDLTFGGITIMLGRIL